ncbi:hypothetical protein L1887_44052 [Cichorium endivia]|nr:hypothetical protein L1887_44052 [Cichorium endivia]
MQSSHSRAMDRRVYLKKGLLMLLATALLIIGLLLVVYSADRLVFAASILCRLTGVPPVVIGMTVVSVGTSLPEIIVSVTASLHGQLDLAVGTAIGSNIVNILLILGLAALLHPFRVHSDVLRRELPLMLIVSLLAGCVFYDGVLSYSDGIFLLALAVIWLLYSVKIARLAEKQGQDSLTREQVAELPREGTLPVALLWLGVALIIMPMATRMVVDNATVLANYFAISELTIGLTVIAIGTSLPELATAIAGARKGEDDIAIGNIIGSNIFNIAIVMGLPALITPGPFNPLAFSRDYGVMLLVSVIFALLCWRRQRQIGKGAGALLTGGFIPGFDFQKAGKEVLEIEREGLAQLDQYINQDFSLACEKMFYCAGKVVVMGMGKSGHIGRKMAATFASTGTSSFFVHPGEAAHGDLGMVTPQDIVIALSNSGESNEILALIPVLKRLQVPLICMTSRPESSMARAADIHLCVKVPKEACPLGLAPTSSTTAALVMGDALAVALLEARGFTPEDFALSHPGGALGRKLLLRVNDIMHTGDEIPHVSKEASLRDALLEITRKNLGMTVVCDDLMKIQGIFTDGDLRRVFDMGVDVRTLGIADVMTPGGIRVRPGTLAVDVLNLMQSRHITSVMVADGDQLLGVVHMHDLLRAGVV